MGPTPEESSAQEDKLHTIKSELASSGGTYRKNCRC